MVALTGVAALLGRAGIENAPSNNLAKQEEPRNRRNREAAEPLTREIPDWAKISKIHRVASDGSGEYMTIVDAPLTKSKPVKRFGSSGRRRIASGLPDTREIEDIGLFFQNRTISRNASMGRESGRRQSGGRPRSSARRGLRLSGMKFVCPKTPAGNPETLHGLNLFATGELAVENCVFWQPSQREKVSKASPFVMGFTVHLPRTNGLKVRIRGNVFRCGVGIMDWDHSKSRLRSMRRSNAT